MVWRVTRILGFYVIRIKNEIDIVKHLEKSICTVEFDGATKSRKRYLIFLVIKKIQC